MYRLLTALLVSLTSYNVWAEEILVAVASNFTAPMNALVTEFEAQTDHEVQLAFGSSGRFYAQIINGAPYQVFLSADQDKPRQLEQAGITVADSIFTYATGALVLWSADAALIQNGFEVLESDFRRLSIANPELAPYGRAAVQVLESLGILEATRTRWVQGENIAQAFQFVELQNAELGFVALSQVSEQGELVRGSGWIVPADLHEPIRQDAALLQAGSACQACKELLNFLTSPDAAKILESYGYQVGIRDVIQ